MKKDRENWLSAAPDALMGYGVIVLVLVCFMILLSIVVAVVRVLVGMGAV